MAAVRIVALEGDQTGQELLEQSLRLLDPGLLGVEVELVRFDLSLENRRATGNSVVSEAAAAMRETGLGLKAATITPEGADDVGSPNRILREEMDGKVIMRTGRRIPGVTPVAGVHHPISVCRMAVGDAYGAEQWREQVDGDELAHRTETIRRSHCRAVAEFAFREAESVLLGLDDELRTTVAMAEAPHGTAPALEGKDIANPMAMILAVAALLHYASAAQPSRAIYEAVLETTAAGTRTPDLSGHATTTEFTATVIELVGRKLDVWAST